MDLIEENIIISNRVPRIEKKHKFADFGIVLVTQIPQLTKFDIFPSFLNCNVFFSKTQDFLIL